MKVSLTWKGACPVEAGEDHKGSPWLELADHPWRLSGEVEDVANEWHVSNVSVLCDHCGPVEMTEREMVHITDALASHAELQVLDRCLALLKRLEAA